MTNRFVKSSNTETPASKSQRDIEEILRRYGATDFSFGSNWTERVARIGFRVPDVPGSKLTVPIRLEISFQAVAEILFGEKLTKPKKRWYRGQMVAADPSKMYAQAERVAWRHLVLWVDAACAAASAGLQTMSEAFLAHTLVRSPDGDVLKVSEMLDRAAKLQGSETGFRGLLPAGPPVGTP